VGSPPGFVNYRKGALDSQPSSDGKSSHCLWQGELTTDVK